MRIYIGSGRSPTSSLKDDRMCVPRLNALKFLQWGARMVEEVGELKLGEGLPEGNLCEPRENGDVVRMRMIGCPERRPRLPLYRVQGQVTYKEEGSTDRRILSLREGA